MSLVVLENGQPKVPGPHGRIFRTPTAIVECRNPETLESALVELEHAQRDGLFAAGFVTYETGYALEPKLAPLMPDSRDMPLLWFGLYEDCEKRDARGMEAFWRDETQPHPATVDISVPQADLKPDAYKYKLGKIADHLTAGDIYQACYTFQLKFNLAGSPRGLYRRLRQAQRAAHGAYIETDEWSVLSFSPELFILRQGDRILTRPMKGTAPRGLDLNEDIVRGAALAADEKNRAENLMIVDLLRNDLSRLAVPGSVRVSAPYHVEPVGPTLTMTATVAATLSEQTPFAGVLQALFPSGSVTGAPKIRAMQILRDLETTPRGVYCGSIGAIDRDGGADFNVAIRTITVCDGRGNMGVGGGIVADSAADMEYGEALLKARFLTQPWPDFALIETMHWPCDDPRIERHLTRLSASADYFGFIFDKSAVRALIGDHVANLQKKQAWRVRLLLSRLGEVSLTSGPVAAPPTEIIVSDDKLDGSDVFLRHKTTNRARYNLAMRVAAPRETIYFNQDGELMEGARSNVFLLKMGQLLTPRLGSGCLPGILRAELISSGHAREETLRFADLLLAEKIFIGNAVMGLVPVKLVT